MRKIDTAKRIERDRLMISQPEKWPHWPILPMKRCRKKREALGFIVAGKTNEIVLGIMFTGECNQPHAISAFEASLMSKRQYESVDALMADG